MKMRHLVWAALLAGGFFYITSVADWDLGRLLQPIRKTGRLWTAPDIAETAGFSNDENQNIEIYRMARQATVNITSIVYREGWFFQLYPE
ncbi:MAG: peptidase S1, partial [Acidobacteria bacterium]|nr:peptidase S1 [Acidobacteriota bacterium]